MPTLSKDQAKRYIEENTEVSTKRSTALRKLETYLEENKTSYIDQSTVDDWL